MAMALLASTTIAAESNGITHGSLTPRQNNPCKTADDEAAKGGQTDGSFHYDSHHVKLVIHKGRGGATFMKGLNIVDEPAQTVCEAVSGCLLVIKPYVPVNSGYGYTCEILDGQEFGGP
jgi:hypothetical protein